MHAIESDSFRTRPRSRARPRESEFYRGRGTRTTTTNLTSVTCLLDSARVKTSRNTELGYKRLHDCTVVKKTFEYRNVFLTTTIKTQLH
jgi:hypothetical protein